MDSTSATSSASSAADPAALRSCLQCHRRMSSLKYDLHTICTQCRGVACSLDTRCPECKTWSSDKMSDYVKHKSSLTGKLKKKPVTSASPTPGLGSPLRLPSVSDDSLISDPRRGCYIVLPMFIFFLSFFFFSFFSLFFPPRFCPGHISGTVTRRDSKLSVLLGPAV